MNFFKANRFYLFGTALAVILWLILFYVLVAPNWEAREEEIGRAQQQLDSWLKFYDQKKQGYLTYPQAEKLLEDEKKLLERDHGILRTIECARDVGPFKLASARGKDPNNYFDERRKEVLGRARKDLGIEFEAGWDDLGFRGKLIEEPVPLNLIRLFVLDRFFTLIRKTQIYQVGPMHYPRPGLIEMPAQGGQAEDAVAGEEGGEGAEEKQADPDTLCQIPLKVQLKAKERDFAQLLYELQVPMDDPKEERSYFLIRGILVQVKNADTGMLDATLALGALFRVRQLSEFGIPFEAKKKPPSFRQPLINPRSY